MKLRAAIVAAGIVLFGNPAFAGDETHPRGVIELFTSQGCSSCPPADALFAEMARKGDVIALAYHVNYWDYLGWRDTLGNRESTERQYSYMRSLRAGSVYTPQVIINGQAHVNGANRQAIDMKLSEQPHGNGLLVDIRVEQSGDSIVIETGTAASAPAKAHLVLVYYDGPRQVEISRGENLGRKATYWNAVTDIQTAGMWHGRAERYEMPASAIAKKGGCAVLLQSVASDGGPGPIIGAAIVRKPPGD